MGKIKDLTGQKFGHLTVLEITNERRNRQVVWKCECDCDEHNIVYVVGQALRTGHTTSCGCSRKGKNVKNIIGQKFHKLTVIKRVGTTLDRNAIWECKCDCGNYRLATTHQLTHMEIRACHDCIDFSSKGEQTIAELLTKNHINFIREFTFSDLRSRNNYCLRFDFAIVDETGKILQLIEYDGLQHFKPSEQFGGKEAFKDLQYRDNLKNEYCKQHNIPLKRISKDYRHLKITDII